MFLIKGLTSDALQTQNLVLPDGTVIALTIYFRDMQLGWFINQLTWGSFTIQGLRITNSPNMLNQWRNLIPFGLSCVTAGGREPSLQQDFSSGTSNLFILTQAEVTAYANFLTNGS